MSHLESLWRLEMHVGWACHLLSCLLTVHIPKCRHSRSLSCSGLRVPFREALRQKPNVNLARSSDSPSAFCALFRRAGVIWHCVPGRLSECQRLERHPYLEQRGSSLPFACGYTKAFQSHYPWLIILPKQLGLFQAGSKFQMTPAPKAFYIRVTGLLHIW